MSDLSRRDLLKTAVAAPLLSAFRSTAQRRHNLDEIAASPSYAVSSSPSGSLAIGREWHGDTCRSRITNTGKGSLRVREVVLADVDLGMPASTDVYGESFQMLSQSGGTLGTPRDLGSYTDAKHYRIPMAEGVQTYFGAMTLSPPGAAVRGLAFTSCRRFAGLFRVSPAGTLQVVVDLEGLTLAPGDHWELEEFMTVRGSTRDAVLREIGIRLAVNHPRRNSGTPVFDAARTSRERAERPPTGWCSWYCFGARVTAQNIIDNLDAIEKKTPGLTYVQIDDGYQPAMGDWLETGAAFGGDVRKVLDTIRQRGFRPAIWVAPFIAEQQSHVFRQHPDWFVKDTDGSPLQSDKVTFGGWRHGPWFVLDGTHPDVQAHFEHVFNTMRKEWGVSYFKLDANFWGAIHGGRFHDPTATRVDAYRRGMEAIRRGAGDGFILGCNHPIWPSLGLIDGSRSSNDIRRSWDRIKTTAQQNLLRGWQNGRLWWNDPDAICLSGDLPENEYVFHATAIYATGGMALSGDDLSMLAVPRLAMLKKLVPPTGIAAEFDDSALRVGRVALADKTMLCCFNWDDTPATLSARLPEPATLRDYWTGELLGRRQEITIKDLPPHSARLLECLRG
jgi:alpha-galactosidase